MSALNFDKWWDGEGKESNKWLSEKGVAKKAWNAAIKAKESGEQRLTKQSTPIFCPDCKSDQVNYKCGNCDYTFIKW